jgi:hypothetical protein
MRRFKLRRDHGKCKKCLEQRAGNEPQLMDLLGQIIGWGELGPSRLGEHLETIEPRLAAAIAIILVLFGAASRRWLNFLGAALLAAIGFFAVIAPGSVAVTLAIGAALCSLLVAFAGFLSRRWEASQREEIDRLGDAVRQLQAAAERQFLRSLNARPPEPSGKEEAPPADRPLE